jgi:hypothetical protein
MSKKEEYVEPNEEGKHVKCEVFGQPWSGTEWIIGKDRYFMAVHPKEMCFGLWIYREGKDTIFERCMGSTIGVSRVYAAIEEYKQKHGRGKHPKCSHCNDGKPHEKDFVHDEYFHQSHSKY